LTIDTPDTRRKAQLDALLLALPGVSARTINGLDAYFTADKMFACISGKGIGLRLPVATATELQFSRDNVVPFQPGGMASTREWIQIDRVDAAAAHGSDEFLVVLFVLVGVALGEIGDRCVEAVVGAEVGAMLETCGCEISG